MPPTKHNLPLDTHLLDLGLALEVLAGDQLGDVVIIGLLALLALLHALVALGQLAQRGQGVGAELVQDAGDELGQLLVLAVAVDGKGVGGDGSVDCLFKAHKISIMIIPVYNRYAARAFPGQSTILQVPPQGINICSVVFCLVFSPSLDPSNSEGGCVQPSCWSWVGPHTLGGGEVNHVAVALEHVDLLDGLDGLDVELLQGLLELLVVGAGPGGRTLHLSAGSALSSDPCGSTELLEALLNVGHGVWKRK